ncbi:MAG: PorV/PorQ family protein [Fidelibacterota bacterium]|nr:MAG: PorV/PorQ family protein [Candidatus Neomarinimicrobiota bacterium]
MKQARLFSYGLLVLFISAQAVSGQIKKQAQTGFGFLENPVTAEVVGRGGYGITNLRNASAVFWNPAGAAWITSRFDLNLHYTKGIADINQTSIALGLKLGTAGVLTLSANVMDYGVFYGTRRPGPGDGLDDWKRGYLETGTFSPEANAFGIGYSRAVSDRFSFGVHMKLAHQDLGVAYLGSVDEFQADSTITTKEYALTVPATDVGAYYDFNFHGLTFGASIMNVSPEVRYEEIPFPLPFAMKFGTSIRPLSLLGIDAAVHDLLIGVETRHARDFGEKVHVGMEYSFLGVFFARSGYMANYSERGATYGMGFHYRGINFDYALQDFGVFGSIHLMSIGLQFGE